MKINKKTKRLIAWIAVLIVFIGLLLIVMGIKGFNGGGLIFFFKNIFLDNFLAVNPILLGLLTFIGYLVLKRGIVDSIVGALKTAIGVLILTIGAGMLVGMAKPIFNGVKNITSANVVPLDPYLGWTSSNDFLIKGISTVSNYVSWVSYALLIGFTFNIVLILLKKFTNIHTLMITGHIMFQQTAILVAVIYIFLFRGVGSFAGREAGTILFSGFLIGTYWGVASGTTLKGAQKITNNAGFAVGHQQMFGAAIAYKVGRFFGKAEDSAETRKVSKKFKIFEDNLFTQIVIILILFSVLIFIIEYATPGRSHAFSSQMGSAKTVKILINNKPHIIQLIGNDLFVDGAKSLVANHKFIIGSQTLEILNKGSELKLLSDGSIYLTSAQSLPYAGWHISGGFWVLNLFLGSLKIVASILVLTTGVRIFVTELQQAFQGISQKIIPGSVVAVDCAATYGFSPNAVTYGFVAGVVGQFLAVGAIIGISLATNGAISIVIPLFITLFFNSGTIGVFANASGGWKACLIVPFIMGFVELFVAAGAIAMINRAYESAVSAGVAVAGNSPIKFGYIGMADWNLIWGLTFLTTGASKAGAYIVFPSWLIIMLLLAQITDNTMQKKQTILQKLLKWKISNSTIKV